MTVGTTQPVRKSVTVQAPPEKAFDVFTAGMGRWWDPEYKIGGEALQTVVVQPHEGGRWYERGEHGAECDWGRVLVWDPPGRVVLAWQISADWQYDPNLTTEVDVRFVATADGTTRVELEHRGLDALGPAGEAMRAIFDSPGGWSGLLQRFSDSTFAPEDGPGPDRCSGHARSDHASFVGPITMLGAVARAGAVTDAERSRSPPPPALPAPANSR